MGPFRAARSRGGAAGEAAGAAGTPGRARRSAAAPAAVARNGGCGGGAARGGLDLTGSNTRAGAGHRLGSDAARGRGAARRPRRADRHAAARRPIAAHGEGRDVSCSRTTISAGSTSGRSRRFARRATAACNSIAGSCTPSSGRRRGSSWWIRPRRAPSISGASTRSMWTRRGNGLLKVAMGWVAFQFDGHESFIPAGAQCVTRKRTGPGIPYYEDAPGGAGAVGGAVRAWRSRGAGRISSRSARPRDGLTLWHLLTRVDAAERGVGFRPLRAIGECPAGGLARARPAQGSGDDRSLLECARTGEHRMVARMGTELGRSEYDVLRAAVEPRCSRRPSAIPLRAPRV